MLKVLKSSVIIPLLKNKYLRSSLALGGARLVVVGFQGYSIAFIPASVLAGTGLFVDVALVFTASREVENARVKITEQKEEIDGIFEEVRSLHSKIEDAKTDVHDLEEDVQDAESRISEAQQETREASETAQDAESEIRDMKQSILRALD